MANLRNTSKTSRLTSPGWKVETPLWRQGFIILGLDEVGRGALFGPVVAACVVFHPYQKIPRKLVINDSKLMTVRQRKEAGLWIRKMALAWAVGEADTAIINKIGITGATRRAFRQAVGDVLKKIGTQKAYLILDGLDIGYIYPFKRERRQAVIVGDRKSYSIAAASIVAKVYRDGLMLELNKMPEYGKFKVGKNKGYGTAEHIKAIRKYGVTRLHRVGFVKTALE